MLIPPERLAELQRTTDAVRLLPLTACRDGECDCGYLFSGDGEAYVAKVIGKGDNVDPWPSDEQRMALIRWLHAVSAAWPDLLTAYREAVALLAVQHTALEFYAARENYGRHKPGRWERILAGRTWVNDDGFTARAALSTDGAAAAARVEALERLAEAAKGVEVKGWATEESELGATIMIRPPAWKKLRDARDRLAALEKGGQAKP